jgi:hypothetical protein
MKLCNELVICIAWYEISNVLTALYSVKLWSNSGQHAGLIAFVQLLLPKG